eukprot:99753_1
MNDCLTQYYTYLNGIIYMHYYHEGTAETRLAIFNMQTQQFESHWHNIIVVKGRHLCLTSMENFLFMVGGYKQFGAPDASEKLQIINLTSNNWIVNSIQLN